METLLFWRSKITKWLTSKDYDNWKSLFLVLSVVLTLFVTLSFEYDFLVFWTAAITSVAIVLSLYELCGVATVQIYSARVSLAWGFINYSLFIAVASSLLVKEEWGYSHVIGMVVAFVASFILVRVCSYISYLCKLNNVKEDDSLFHVGESKFNRCNFYVILSIIFLMVLMNNEGNTIKNYEEKQKIEQEISQFSQQKWYLVTEWHTEILDGNTIYVIKCAKGRLGIHPSKYPQIRDIKSTTQVKFLVDYKKDGLIFPKKFDIKN